MGSGAQRDDKSGTLITGKVGEAVQNTLGAVVTAIDIPLGLVKDAARPAYWTTRSCTSTAAGRSSVSSSRSTTTGPADRASVMSVPTTAGLSPCEAGTILSKSALKPSDL